MVVNENWKPNFYRYEQVRQSGRYNIIVEAGQAIETCGISSREYRDILLSYNVYKRYVEAKYGTIDNFMRKYKKCDF